MDQGYSYPGLDLRGDPVYGIGTDHYSPGPGHLQLLCNIRDHKGNLIPTTLLLKLLLQMEIQGIQDQTGRVTIRCGP